MDDYMPDASHQVCKTWETTIIGGTGLSPLDDLEFVRPGTFFQIAQKIFGRVNPPMDEDYVSWRARFENALSIRRGANRFRLFEVQEDGALFARKGKAPSFLQVDVGGETAQYFRADDRRMISDSPADLTAGKVVVLGAVNSGWGSLFSSPSYAPLGTVDNFLALTSGKCARVFSIAADGDGLATSPERACKGELRLVSVASLEDRREDATVSVLQADRNGFAAVSTEQITATDWGLAQRLVERSRLDLFGAGDAPVRLSVPAQFASLSDADIAFSSLVNTAKNASSLLQARIEQNVANVRLDALLESFTGESLELRSLETSFANIVAQILPGTISLWLPEAPEISDACGEVPTPGPNTSSPTNIATPRQRATARWATYVRNPDGESLVSYYSDFGDNLRVADVTRGVIDDFQYNTKHDQVGAALRSASGDPLGPLTCTTFNDRHLPIVVTDLTPDGEDWIQQCVAWSQHGPWATGVTTPRSDGDDIAWLVEFHRDRLGNVHLARDEAGNETDFSYDPQGRLVSMRRPDGSSTAFSDYDPALGFARGVTVSADGESRTTRYTFDGWGHVESETRTGWGVDRTWDWEDRIRLTTSSVTTEETSQTRGYQYGENGWLEKVTSPTLVTELQYGADRRVSRAETWSVKNPADRRVECVDRYFDGAVKKHTSDLGIAVAVDRTYSGTEMVLTAQATGATDPNCATPPADAEPIWQHFVSQSRYDGASRLVGHTDNRSVVERHEHDAFGRVQRIFDGTGAWIEARRDASGRIVQAALFPPGAELPDSLADAASVPAALQYASATYDDREQRLQWVGWIRNEAGNLERSVEFAKDLNVQGRTLVTTQNSVAGEFVVTNRFDGFGRFVASTSNAGDKTVVEYADPVTAVVSVKGPDGSMVTDTRQYDRGGRLRTVRDVAGKVTFEAEYDDLGRTDWTRDEAGFTDLTLDDYGRTRTVERLASLGGASLESSGYVFDNRGRLTTVTSGDRDVAGYEYDTLGRVVRETRPAANPAMTAEPRVTVYFGTSNVVAASKLPSGRRFEYKYNDPRNLLTLIEADATRAQNVEGPEKVAMVFERGVTGAVEDASTYIVGSDRTVTLAESVARVYDGAGRIVHEQPGGAPSLAVGTKYGFGGSIARQTIAGEAVTLTHRTDGRLENITHDDLGQFLNLEYSGAGGPSDITRGDSLTEARTFDPRGRLKSQAVGDLKLGYGYGNDGFLRRITTTVGTEDSSLLVALDAAGRVTMDLGDVPGAAGLDFDELDNAAIHDFSGSANALAGFEYDASGNWLEVTDIEGSAWDPDANDGNAYQDDFDGGVLDYDADGRLVRTEDGGQSFHYNALGQLARVESDGGTSCTYGYDAFGRRAYEKCDDQETRFGWDGHNLVAEQDIATGDVAVTIHAGGVNTPVARINTATGDVFHLVQGATGNVHAAFDSSGALVETYQYSAFGETEVIVQEGRSPTGNRLAFHGHMYDPATGLYNMRARYYSPTYGRFISQDPIGVAGGVNLYGFARNNALAFWDPFGLKVNNPSTEPWYATMTAQILIGLSQPGVANAPDSDDQLLDSRNVLEASASQAVSWVNPFKLLRLPPGVGIWGDDVAGAAMNAGGKGTGALDDGVGGVVKGATGAAKPSIGRRIVNAVTHRGGNRQVVTNGQRWHLPAGAADDLIPAADALGDLLQTATTAAAKRWNASMMSVAEQAAVSAAQDAGKQWLATLLKAQAKGRWVEQAVRDQLSSLPWSRVGPDLVVNGVAYDIMSGTVGNMAAHADRMSDIIFRYVTF